MRIVCELASRVVVVRAMQASKARGCVIEAGPSIIEASEIERRASVQRKSNRTHATVAGTPDVYPSQTPSHFHLLSRVHAFALLLGGSSGAS